MNIGDRVQTTVAWSQMWMPGQKLEGTITEKITKRPGYIDRNIHVRLDIPIERVDGLWFSESDLEPIMSIVSDPEDNVWLGDLSGWDIVAMTDGLAWLVHRPCGTEFEADNDLASLIRDKLHPHRCGEVNA